jgi:hypothetical protein
LPPPTVIADDAISWLILPPFSLAVDAFFAMPPFSADAAVRRHCRYADYAITPRH